MFTGTKWWEQTNPAYRESCRKKAIQELIELNKQYNYFIKQTK